MPQISVFFRKVFENQETYLNQRVTTLNYAGNYSPDHINQVISTALLQKYVEQLLKALKEDIHPPLSDVIDFSSLDKSLLVRKDCMLSEIDKLFPPNDGEYTKMDEVYYLNEAWKTYPKHSIILKRVTNLSECLYVYPRIQADPENNNLIEQYIENGETPMPNSIDANSTDFGEVAKLFARGLTGLLPPPLNVLGATLISKIWPDSGIADKDWKAMYNSLQTIIKNGLAQNNITVASTKLQGFVFFINTEYLALKDTPTVPKQQLLDALAPYNVAFFLNIVNFFMYPQENKKGLAAATFANFMTGACLHMGLNQERALVDPSVSKPSESGFARTVSYLAISYSDYARKIAPIVKQLRLAQIGEVQTDSDTLCDGGHCTTTFFFWFEDSNNGYTSPKFNYNSSQKRPPDAQGDAQAARNTYYKQISDQMDARLQSQVYDVLALWEKLIINPVPKPTAILVN